MTEGDLSTKERALAARRRQIDTKKFALSCAKAKLAATQQTNQAMERGRAGAGATLDSVGRQLQDDKARLRSEVADDERELQRKRDEIAEARAAPAASRHEMDDDAYQAELDRIEKRPEAPEEPGQRDGSRASGSSRARSQTDQQLDHGQGERDVPLWISSGVLGVVIGGLMGAWRDGGPWDMFGMGCVFVFWFMLSMFWPAIEDIINRRPVRGPVSKHPRDHKH